MTVGTILRDARRSRGLTQEGLALATGLSDNFIGLLERDERNMSLRTASAIAKALGVSIEIFGFQEDEGFSIERPIEAILAEAQAAFRNLATARVRVIGTLPMPAEVFHRRVENGYAEEYIPVPREEELMALCRTLYVVRVPNDIFAEVAHFPDLYCVATEANEAEVKQGKIYLVETDGQINTWQCGEEVVPPGVVVGRVHMMGRWSKV